MYDIQWKPDSEILTNDTHQPVGKEGNNPNLERSDNIYGSLLYSMRMLMRIYVLHVSYHVFYYIFRNLHVFLSKHTNLYTFFMYFSYRF